MYHESKVLSVSRMWWGYVDCQSSAVSSNMLQIAHCKIDCCETGVSAATSSDPDRSMDIQRGAKELAFLLWLLTWKLLVKLRG